MLHSLSVKQKSSYPYHRGKVNGVFLPDKQIVHGVIDVVYTYREELLFSTNWNPDVANGL